MRRGTAIGLGLGGLGIGLCAAGWVLQREVLMPSLLWSGLFWLNLSLGCITLRLIHGLSGGEWGRFAGPVFAAGAAALPVAALAFLPLLWGLDVLFPWHAPPATLPEAVRAKAVWLNAEFFTARSVLSLLLWLLMAWLTWNSSPIRPPLAAGLLILQLLLVSLFAFDWVMSLDPKWFSSILGLLVGAAQVLAAGALTVLTVNRLQPWREAGDHTKARVDLGNLLLAFALFWIYLAFSQYLIIWSANLPEEVIWYLDRAEHGWKTLGVLTVMLQFALPFAALISRRVKHSPRALVAVAATLLAGHLLYVAWLTLPSFRDAAWDLRWTDVAAFAAVGGPWGILFRLRLQRAAERMKAPVPAREAPA